MARPLLVIAKDEPFRESLEAVLEAAGYGVLVVQNGEEGLVLARLARPQLILLDLDRSLTSLYADLPVMNATEFLAARWEDAYLRSVPVVVLSAWLHLMTDRQSREVAHVLAKPFDAGQLLQIVSRALRVADSFSDRSTGEAGPADS